MEGWQAKLDGVVASYLHPAIPLLWRGGKHKHFVMHTFSNRVEGLHNATPFVQLQQTAVLSDGVVASYLHPAIPLLWRGGRHKHFVMHAFSNRVEGLHNVTPFVQLQQTAVLSDGVVSSRLH